MTSLTVFLEKNKNFALGVSLFVLILAASWTIRLYPLTTNVSSDASEQATMVVLGKLKASLALSIEKIYPGLSPQEKKKMLQAEFDRTLREETTRFNETILKVAKGINLGSMPPSTPYLLASDSFYYYELTQNIERTGRVAEVIKGSKFFHPAMLAPEGHWEPRNLHPYVGYAVHRVVSHFCNWPMMSTAGFTPLFVCALTILAYLFLCRKLLTPFWPALLAGFFLFLSPIYLKRSCYGWYDNDPYNVLFPILTLALFFHGLQRLKTSTDGIKQGILCAAGFALYSQFWHGWMFLLGVFVLSGLLTIGYQKINTGQIILGRPTLTYLGILSLGSLLGIGLLFGPGEFFILIGEGWEALTNFLKPRYSLWPDLYIGVGELRGVSWAGLIKLLGSPLFCVFSLTGYILQWKKLIQRKHPAPQIPITVTVYLLASLLLALGAQRFALLVLVPIAVGALWTFEEFFTWLKQILSRGSDHWVRRIRRMAVPIILGLLIALTPLRTATKEMPRLLNRIYNATWDKTLTLLQSATPPGSIITSWWPPGHFIKAVARRPVNFDGATINKPAAYWVSNILISTDEKQALGLLRMLNLSGNKATEFLTDRGLKLSKAVELLKRSTSLPKKDAENLYLSILTPKDAHHLLGMTHGRPPTSYFLIYNEMIEKHIQHYLVAKWDIAAMEELNNNPQKRTSVPEPGSSGYIPYLWKLAGGQPKYSGIMEAISVDNDQFIFPHNLIINRKKMTATIDSSTYGRGIPLSVFSAKGTELVEQMQTKPSLAYSVILFERNDKTHAVLMDRHLAQSLMMKLHFYEGLGFDHIRMTAQNRDLSGRTHIQVFRVDWDSFIPE